MRIIIDSNIFLADPLMSGTKFRLLFEGLALLPATLRIPEVVVDEVVNGYREKLESQLRDYIAQKDALARLIPGRARRKPSIDVAKLTQDFRERLETTIGRHGSILPYPEIDHKAVVARALARRKPFKSNGDGYRDFLIWKTVQTQLYWGSEGVVFLTANSKDFGKDELDDELKADIINPGRLRVIHDLTAFNKEFVTPMLASLDDLRTSLQSLSAPIDIPEWIHGNIFEILADDMLGPTITGMPVGIGSVRAFEVIKFGKIIIKRVQALASGERLVTVLVNLDVDVSVDVDSRDCAFSQEARDWVGIPAGSFDFYSSHHAATIDIVVELTVDAATTEVTSHSVESMGLAPRTAAGKLIG